VVASLRLIVLPWCVLALTLVLGASAGWSGPASGLLAALVAIMVAVISTMVTGTAEATRREEGPRDR
jgi:hypothetical protein